MAAGDMVVISEDGAGHRGVYYDGTDDYTLVDAHAVARVAANDTKGTYTAWIYVDSAGANYEILSAGDNNSANELLSFSREISTGYLQIYLKQAGVNQFIVRGGTVIPTKTWTHVAVVQNGTRPILYVNGEMESMTDVTSTDLTMWYDELTLVDKFAIGVLESNGGHTNDWSGAIGRVKYWNKALSAAEILQDYKGEALDDDGTYLQLNITNRYDGTTDSGLGADNGTLTGHAHYGGVISDWSYQIEQNSSGHAAEFITSHLDGNKYVSEIKKGD